MAFFTDEPASQGKGGKGGDWICTGCNNSNYGFRKECQRCGTSKYAGKVVCPDLMPLHHRITCCSRGAAWYVFAAN
jgi:hypothetical protein